MKTIAEVAKHSGFSASSLRYYEQIGLLEGVDRTSSGYRTYDDDVLERLAFIARAKQLGCTLDEITSLISIWSDDKCSPLQNRLSALIDQKVADARFKITDLESLISDLTKAVAGMQNRSEGSCDESCGCLNTVEYKQPDTPVVIRPHPPLQSPAPIACTLSGGAMTQRIDEWHAILRYATNKHATSDGARVSFSADLPVMELTQLVIAEQHCCSFFRFSLTVDERGVELDVQVPDDGLGMLIELLGDLNE